MLLDPLRWSKATQQSLIKSSGENCRLIHQIFILLFFIIHISLYHFHNGVVGR